VDAHGSKKAIRNFEAGASSAPLSTTASASSLTDKGHGTMPADILEKLDAHFDEAFTTIASEAKDEEEEIA
jgi:hypothetical protein